MLIPGLGVSYEIFLPLIDHPEEVAERITRMQYEKDIIGTSID